MFPVTCGNRFCQECGASRRARIRRKTTELFRVAPVYDGESVKFLTLTVPNSTDPSAQLDLLFSAWRRLRQQAYFKSRIRGGVTFAELTGEPGAWHCHLHVIMVSRFIPVEKLSLAWSRVGPGKIVHIKRIPPGAAVAYLTKYALKSELPEDVQFVVTRLLKGRRLFQPFGNMHGIMSQIDIPRAVCPTCLWSAWIWNGGQGAIARLYGTDYPRISRSPIYIPLDGEVT